MKQPNASAFPHGGDVLATQGPSPSTPTPRSEGDIGADAFATGGMLQDAQPTPSPGQRIANRYTILRLLGAGGMGQVFLVHDSLCDQQLALKRLHPHLAHDSTLQKRFIEEIKIAQTLSHPGFLKIVGVDQDPERSEIFYLMEYLPGETLETTLKARHPRPFSLPEALSILGPLAEALDALHQMGILHRDLKPSNIYLPHNGRPRLMDLGIARLLQDPSKHTLPTNAGIGTAYYMAPEQLRGQSISTASDIFSFGVLAYEMLTQHLPIGIPKPPSRLAPDLPKALDEILFQALDADPHERPPSATALTHALVATQQPITAPHALATTQQPTAPVAPSSDALSLHHRSTQKNPTPAVQSPTNAGKSWLWVSLALILIGALGAIGFFFSRPPTHTTPSNTRSYRKFPHYAPPPNNPPAYPSQAIYPQTPAYPNPPHGTARSKQSFRQRLKNLRRRRAKSSQGRQW